MKKIVITFMAFVAIVLVACAAESGKGSEETRLAAPVLVAFFSAQGHTKAAAEKVAKVTGGKLFRIEPKQPYTEEDLDGWNDSARGTRESKDRSTRPEIVNRVQNFEQYDTIYIGFPIWWYTAPTIINTFLESYDTAGKIIIPFATSGGSGYGNTEKDLRVSAPDAIFRPGKVLNGYSQKQVNDWIESVR